MYTFSQFADDSFKDGMAEPFLENGVFPSGDAAVAWIEMAQEVYQDLYGGEPADPTVHLVQ